MPKKRNRQTPKSKMDGGALMFGPLAEPELKFDPDAVRKALKESRTRHTVKVRV